MNDAAPLALEDTAEILARLEAHADDVVLIGGQAVNAWAGQFLDTAPDLESLGPYASKDIDFQARLSAVEACARDLGQPLTCVQQELAEPFIGYLDFPSKDGDRRVDFLRSPLGLTAKEVEGWAINVELLDTRVRLMHPLHCLISRAENVVIKPEKYDTEHGNRQLRASMVSLAAFLRATTEAGNQREALSTIEALATYCCGPTAKTLIETKSLDLFSTVAPDLSLPPKFWERRYPQLVEKIRTSREKASPPPG